LKGIASPPALKPERGRPQAFEQKVADKAVSAYFHQYEIVVTTPGALQANFMHMKEAG
jgi:hypothetical protein